MADLKIEAGLIVDLDGAPLATNIIALLLTPTNDGRSVMNFYDSIDALAQTLGFVLASMPASGDPDAMYRFLTLAGANTASIRAQNAAEPSQMPEIIIREGRPN